MNILENEKVEQWLTNVKVSSAKQYLYLFNRFCEHFDLRPDDILDLAINDKGKCKSLLNKWYNHFRGSTSRSYAALAENAVKSFLKFHEVSIKTKARSKARKYQKGRVNLRKQEIKRLIESAPHLRDKALIMLAFQTGMSISDLLKLNYTHMKNAIENETTGSIGIIRYIRGKSETESIAHFGQDSIALLKQYIKWRIEKHNKLTNESPLFTTIRRVKIVNKNDNGEEEEYYQDKRLTNRSAQNMMSLTIVKAGLTTFDELESYGTFNPWGFHAVRKAFSSVAKQYGMPEDQIKMSMGHTLAFNGAYVEFEEKEMTHNYKKVEPYLSIYSDVKELEEKTEALEEKTKEIDTLKEEVKEMKELFEQIKSKIGLD